VNEYRPPEEIRDGFEIYDDRFRAMIPEGAKLVKHYTGTEWSEGPVYIADGDYLIWSDIPNDRMMKFSDSEGASVFRQPAGYSNGNYLDHEGRLVSCEHGNRRISRTEPDGKVVTLADSYEDKKLNSPNDIVVKSDGTIWFTDPPYGILSDHEGHKADSELGANYVFRLAPDSGALEIVCDNLEMPNGLAFSPDETILYVSDTGQRGNIVAFDVEDGKRLTNQREFAVVSPGKPDGFRLDTDGNIFTSAWDGIQVYSPRQELLGKILIPEQRTANCCFGGPGKNRLYTASDTSMYSVVLNAQGIQTP
jgi:gluconolactonase